MLHIHLEVKNIYSLVYAKGFSLVELLVVVAIIGVLAGVGVVGYDRYVENTKRKVLEQMHNNIVRAVETEFTILSNQLGSAMKERDNAGNWIQRAANGTPTTSSITEATASKVGEFTTCYNFVWSLKKHFESNENGFENPWVKGKKAITIDTEGRANHKQGHIQMYCYLTNGGFGSGSGCAISSGAAAARVHTYFTDRGSQGTGPNPKEMVAYIGGGNFSTNWPQKKSDCGWADSSASTDPVYGAWKVTNSILSEADY